MKRIMVSGNEKKEKNGKNREKLIFFEALLTIYALMTLAAAFMFEFHTVYVSRGDIIFSPGMSWQVILFAVELATIITQIVSIALILKKNSQKAAGIACRAGYVAGAVSVLCVICLLCTQGVAVIPLVPFTVYALIICIVRAWIIPCTVKKNENLRQNPNVNVNGKKQGKQRNIN